MNRSTNKSGFTLIELMIVVAIVGILAAIAYPSYQDSIRKGHRNDGQAVLMEAAGRQETYYAKKATYTTDEVLLNISTTSPEGYYTIDITTANATSYIIEATPTSSGGQNNDTIQGFRLSSTGERKYKDSSGTWNNGWSGN